MPRDDETAREEMERHAYRALGAFYTDTDPDAMPLLEEILEDVGLEEPLAAAQVIRRMYRDEAWRLDDPLQLPTASVAHSFEGRLREAGVPIGRSAEVVERIRLGAVDAWGGRPDGSDILVVLRRVNGSPRTGASMAYGALHECWERLWGPHASKRAAATCCANPAERALAEAMAEKGYLLCPPGTVPREVWLSESPRNLLLLGAVPVEGHRVSLLALRPRGEGGIVVGFAGERAPPDSATAEALRAAGLTILACPAPPGAMSPAASAEELDAALRSLPVPADPERVLFHGNTFGRVGDWSRKAIPGREARRDQ